MHADASSGLWVSRLAAAFAASLAALEAHDGVDTVANDTPTAHRHLRLGLHAHLAGARLLGDDILGVAIAQMRTHWLLGLRLEIDGFEILRHFCCGWAGSGWL